MEAVSLKLGSLRLSNRFLEDDPPSKEDLRRLRKHVRGELGEMDLAKLRRGEQLVGTGGTVRNLAKIDARRSDFPVERVHGYLLSRDSVGEIVELLCSTKSSRRDQIPGLSDDRADSIVGGAIGIESLMDTLRADEIVVSGQGVREGLALSQLGANPPSIEAVRRTSFRSLGLRFDTWNEKSADRRRGLATALYRALEPKTDAVHVEALALAAYLLDTGRTLDFFNRHEHTAEILMAAALDGFSQREIALVAAVARRAGASNWDPAEWFPLIDDETRAIERAAVVLLLADELEERCRGERALSVRTKVGRSSVTVRVKGLVGWRDTKLSNRFHKAFARDLVVI